MPLRVTELGGFMSGGMMIPDPGSIPLGQSGVFWAKGGATLPSNPNGDYGMEWTQASNYAVRVGADIFDPPGGTTYNKFAGGRVPRHGDDGLANYAEKDIVVSLFQDATVYVRVEGLVLRYFDMGSWHTSGQNCMGYALRIDGSVDMGTQYPSAQGWGYERYFDPNLFATGNNIDMRVPQRRMNSNGTAVCVHVSTTWGGGPDIGHARIGAGTGDWQTYSPMAFCCSSTHSIALTAGTHTIGVDIFCSSSGNAVATFEGGKYGSVQSLAGGTLTASTTNMWGTVGSGVITGTGTFYIPGGSYYYAYKQNINATVTYTSPTGLFSPVEGGDGCAGGGGTGTGNPGGGGGGPGGGGGGCFKAGTLITMANGRKKPIERIEPGDMVLTARMAGMPAANMDSEKLSRYGFNGSSPRLEPGMVRRVLPGPFYRHYSINSGVLKATPEHPILIAAGGTYRFLPACRVQPGHTMIGPTGAPVMVDSIEEVRDPDTYFNFICDGHTYIANGVIVHNPNGEGDANKS